MSTTTTPPAWTPNTLYFLPGMTVANGISIYAVKHPGKSGTGNGPSGYGQEIQDGHIVWSWVSLIPGRYALLDGPVGGLRQVIGWYDTEVLRYRNLPDENLLVPVTDNDFWNARLGARVWLGADGVFTLTPPPAPPPDVATALAALQKMTVARETAGFHFAIPGVGLVLFSTDPSSQGRLSFAYQLAKEGQWPDGSAVFTAAGEPIPLTSDQLISLAIATGKYVLSVSNYAASLIPRVMAQPTLDITQGWPSNGGPVSVRFDTAHVHLTRLP